MRRCSNFNTRWSSKSIRPRNMNELPMHDAARDGDLEKVRQLIEAGVPVDSLNEIGATPLHIAAFYERYEVAALLIDSNCNIDLQDHYGQTPVIVAAADGSQNNITDLLLHRGAQVNCADVFGCTLLHHVTRYGWKDIVHLILGEADLNAVDHYGETPLMSAVMGGHKETTALLIQAGADIDVKNNRGETALKMGSEFWELMGMEFGVEEITLFVQKGAFLEGYMPFYLRKNVLKDVELCTQSVVNKFNRQSLPALNSITYFATRLPNVDNFKLGARHIDEVKNLVKCEIERNTYCNVVNVRPVALSALCVLSLITISIT